MQIATAIAKNTKYLILKMKRIYF